MATGPPYGTVETPWPEGDAFRFPAEVRSAVAWALEELPRRHAETGREQMMAIDATSGAMLLLLQGTGHRVVIPPAESRRVFRGRGPRSLVMLHTHGEDGGFSGCDFATFSNDPHWALSVLCPAGGRSTYWLARECGLAPGDYRYDGRNFAVLGEALDETAEEMGIPSRRSYPLRNRRRYLVGSRRRMVELVDRAGRLMVRRLNDYHDAGISYASFLDADASSVEDVRLWSETDEASTRIAYGTLCENAAQSGSRTLVLLALAGLLPSLALPLSVPLLGGLQASRLAVAGLALAVPLLVFLLPVAVLKPFRRKLGSAILAWRRHRRLVGC